MAKRDRHLALRGELPAILGVSRSRAYALAARPSFPAPAFHTAYFARPLWRISDVQRWNAKRLAKR